MIGIIMLLSLQLSNRRYRDDIVFIPGESGHAPSDQLTEFCIRNHRE